MAKIRYSFLFPYRWLKEDKKFLKKNLERSIPLHKNQNPAHQTLIDDEPQVISYSVRIKQHAYQPKSYTLTKEEMTELLSDVFPGTTCRFLEKFFVQKGDPSGLPVMELEIFY